jgi:hypothetical protein
MHKFSFLLGAALASALAGQQIVIPAAAATIQVGTSQNMWREIILRYQTIYDSTNFTTQGTGQPIVINNVEFRMADGLIGTPTVTYPSVEIYIEPAAVNYLTPSTIFQNNRVLARPRVPEYAGPVTLNPGAGTTPNNYVVNIPLTNTVSYSPEAGVDLIVELVVLAPPTTPTISTMVSSSSTAHLANSIRSLGSTAATSGTASAFGLCVRLGYTDQVGAATHTAYGAGCYPRTSTFYENFPGSSNDLTNKTVTMSQNANGGYDVVTTPGATIVAPTGVGLALTDDSVSPNIFLPFTFNYPGGGASTAIIVDSNGSVLLNGTTTSNIGGTPAALFNTVRHRLSPAMQDLLPDGATNINNVFHNVDPGNPNIYLITWNNVPCFSSVGPLATFSTFQVALINNGTSDTVEFRYQTLFNDSDSNGGTCITGYSRGGGIDPGNSDLTAGLVSTVADIGPLTLSGAPRPILGNPVNYTVSNARANAGLSVIYATFGQTGPIPLTLYGLDAPNCFGHIDVGSAVVFSPLLIGAGSLPFGFTWPIGPYSGAVLYMQAAEIALLENNAGVITSNGLQVKLGTL